MKEKFWSNFLKGALLGCAVLLCSPMVLYLCYATINSFENRCTSREIADIQEMGRFQIPKNAKNVEICLVHRFQDRVDARFEIRSSELETFIQNTNLDLPLATTRKPAQFWKWDKEVDSVENYLYGKYVGNFTQEVLVNTSNPESYVVYVWVSGGD
jgi:hypothetical protein